MAAAATSVLALVALPGGCRRGDGCEGSGTGELCLYGIPEMKGDGIKAVKEVRPMGLAVDAVTLIHVAYQMAREEEVGELREEARKAREEAERANEEAERARKEKALTVRRLLEMGLSVEQVAGIYTLSAAEVERIRDVGWAV